MQNVIPDERYSVADEAILGARLGVVSKEQLKRIGELAEKKEWAALSAYVMNQADDSDDEDVFSL